MIGSRGKGKCVEEVFEILDPVGLEILIVLDPLIRDSHPYLSGIGEAMFWLFITYLGGAAVDLAVPTVYPRIENLSCLAACRACDHNRSEIGVGCIFLEQARCLGYAGRGYTKLLGSARTNEIERHKIRVVDLGGIRGYEWTNALRRSRYDFLDQEGQNNVLLRDGLSILGQLQPPIVA